MPTAVYAGTFDPITSGHLSVVYQAARIFSHLRILVATNPGKKTLFDAEERAEMINELLSRMPQVSVDTADDLVVEYARSIGASFLVRGIRSASDAEFETQLAQANRRIAPEITTVLIPAEPKFSDVSSSRIKAKVYAGEDTGDACPQVVLERLKARLDGGDQ